MPVKKAFLVLRAFDWSPRASVIQTFKAGQIVHGLTRECIAKGMKSNALKRLK